MSWSLNIGTIAGTAVRVHITFLLFLVWIFLASYSAEGQEAAVTSIVFLLLLFACVLAHEFGHIFTARAFGVATPDVTLLADRRPRPPRAHPGGALSGIPHRHRRAAGECRDRARADGGCGRSSQSGRSLRSREPACVDDRQARGREPVPRRVQHDPGLSDGRRPRAARAARDQARLRPRDRGRRLDRPGRGVRARLHGAVLQPDADLHRHLRLPGGGIRSARRGNADHVAGRAGQHRHDDAVRDVDAGRSGRARGRDAAAHQPERIPGGRFRPANRSGCSAAAICFAC